MSTQEAAVQWDKHNFFEISFLEKIRLKAFKIGL